MDTEKQGLIIHNSIELFRSAPDILRSNQDRTSKAIIVGTTILDQWQSAWEIKDEDEKLKALQAADERSNKFLVNCSLALTQETELRAGITQMMDAFKQMFFDAERDLDRDKANTVPNKIQGQRNAFVKESFQISERKRLEAEKKAAKAKEVVTIRATIETALFNKYNEYLRERKMRLQSGFNGITLDTFQEVSEKLTYYHPGLKDDVLPGLQVNVLAVYHSPAEIQEFKAEIIKLKYPEWAANYKAELNLLKDELVDKLPSKKAELLEQKRLADEAIKIAEQAAAAKTKAQQQAAVLRAQELKKQQEEALEAARMRAEEDQKRIDKQALESKEAEELKIDIQKQADETMVLFDKESDIADSQMKAGSVKQGYEITVLHPVGYTQIFQLWFENEGKNLGVDKIGNTKLDQMKSWCEKQALKKGTKIESKFLKYDDSFTAINRKAKAEVKEG